jgi:formylmethanofuran dehydrogenase subunit E
MYRYKKLLWVCEECGVKTEYLSLKNGKHVCGECSNKSNDQRSKK